MGLRKLVWVVVFLGVLMAISVGVGLAADVSQTAQATRALASNSDGIDYSRLTSHGSTAPQANAVGNCDMGNTAD